MAKKTIPKKLNNNILKYVNELKNDNLPIEKIILFGSFAKGKQHKWSDVDLCVVSPKFKDSWSAMNYLWSKLTFNMNYTIEPVGFNPKDFNDKYSSLVNEIKTTGIEIKLK
ncbi:MAG: nucleotidyltransferase domain-containing protein [Parcubacteria group bacterium]|nr:nucleotidyltransferase domain-containing protein [Parcubacteria group bacterium]